VTRRGVPALLAVEPLTDVVGLQVSDRHLADFGRRADKVLHPTVEGVLPVLAEPDLIP